MKKEKTKFLYSFMWRWHFYAGLIFSPLILLLALSGSVYLFKPQIENIMYKDFYEVKESGERIVASEQIESVLDKYPDSAVRKYRPGEDPARSAEVHIQKNDETVTVFVNPYNGEIIGELPNKNRLFDRVEEFHGELMLGTFGDRLVELAACWTLVLIVTGLYLWFPNRKPKILGLLIPRFKSGKKVLVRDFHVVPGFWISAGLAFLLITGLLWSGFWGTNVQNITTNSGFGYPPSIWVGSAPSSTIKTKDIADVSWNAQNLPVPSSQVQGFIPVSIDDVVKIADDINVHPTYTVIFPSTKEGVYTLSAFPPKARDEATIHIDQYIGAVLADYRYNHYEPLGKLMAWGITVHKGLEYGLANQITLLLLCLGVIGVLISGVVLWWKRKPSEHIGAPKALEGRTPKGFIILLVIMGLVFPLVGLSIIVILLLDWLIIRRVPKLKKFFNC
jgi:uncharacterized iron-regulated membrane protein